MITNPEKSPEVILSGIRKAAILLVTVGDQASAEFVRQLNEDEVQMVSREIARIGTITAEHAEVVLGRVLSNEHGAGLRRQGRPGIRAQHARERVRSETAKKLVDRLMKALGTDAASLDALQKADPQQLAKFVHSEHPQTIALVLSHMNPSARRGTADLAAGQSARGCGASHGNLDQISPDVIHKIALVLGQKLKALGEFSRESYGGVRAVAEMFNRLDSGTSKDILEISSSMSRVSRKPYRHLMFVFEDMLMIDPNGIKEVLGKIDRKILTVALKGTSDQLKNHFLQAMSQRGAEMLREDMDSAGTHQDQGRGSRAATDHRRGAAAGG